MALNAIERETVIVINDADDTMSIHTHQRSMYTKLMKNPSATLVRDLTFGNQPGGEFELPKGLLTIRSGKRAVKKSASRQFVDNKVNRCGEKKPDGTLCQAPAKKDTGKCRWHS